MWFENPNVWAAVTLFITQLFGFLGLLAKNRSQDGKIERLESDHKECMETNSEKWPSDQAEHSDLLVTIKALKDATGQHYSFGDVAKIRKQLRIKRAGGAA